MSNWQKHSIDERKAIIQAVSAERNIEDNAVEKDWWVTMVLKALFQTSCKDYLLFKGLCAAIHKPLNTIVAKKTPPPLSLQLVLSIF